MIRRPNNDHFQRTLMTDEKHRQIDAILINLVTSNFRLQVDASIPSDLAPQIAAAIKRSKVGPVPKSSGMCPVPENPPIWVVCLFGSVWTDIMVDGRIIRVCWYEDDEQSLFAIPMDAVYER